MNLETTPVCQKLQRLKRPVNERNKSKENQKEGTAIAMLCCDSEPDIKVTMWETNNTD